MRWALVVCLTLLAVGPAEAAAPAWVASGPDGGTIYSVARSHSDPTVVYALGDTVWRSTDSGVHWAPFSRPRLPTPVFDLQVGGDGSDVLYGYNHLQMYRSGGGGPWQSLSDEILFFDAWQVDPVVGTRLLGVTLTGTGAGDKLCWFVDARRSTDAGTTFATAATFFRRCGAASDRTLDFRDAQLLADPGTAGRTWLLVHDNALHSYLFRTDDAGSTWHAEVVPADVARIALPAPRTDLVGLTAGGLAVYHRPVVGGTWAIGAGPCGAGVPEPFMLVDSNLLGCAGTSVAGNVTALIDGAGGQPPLASDAARGVIRQSGASWVLSASGLAAQHISGAVRLADASVVISGERGLFRQNADGSWIQWNDGLPVQTTGDSVTGPVRSDHLRRALVTTGDGLYRRAAADAAWTKLTTPFANLTAVTTSISADQPIYLQGLGPLGAGNAPDPSYASDDDGATWRPMSGLDDVVYFIVPSETEPGVAYAASGPASWPTNSINTRMRLYRTLDRGHTWQPTSAPGDFMWLAVDPGDHDHLIAWNSVGSQIVVSHDGGATWRGTADPADPRAPQVTSGGGGVVFAFDREAPGVIYAGTVNLGLWASADDGVTWGPVAGTDTGSGITSFLDEGTPVPSSTARVASTWRLYGTVSNVGSGFARIDARVRLARLRGKPHAHVTRTERISTCSGAAAIGAKTLVRWLYGRQVVATGRRVRLPASSVGRKLVCEIRADTPYANVARQTKPFRPVGRPFSPRPTIRGGRKVGSRAICLAPWRGAPAKVTYTWRVGGTVRGHARTYMARAADGGRKLTCTTTGRNRYGRFTPRRSAAVKVRR